MVKREVQTNLLKMLKSKKGISPILATLLLIVIAVAAIVVTYAWVMTFMGAQTGAGGTLLELEIEPSWNTTAKTTTIVIRNVGTSDARIVRLWIGETTSGLVQVTDSTNIGTGKLLSVEQIVTVILDWPNNLTTTSWTSGKIYYFKAVPEVGAALEFSSKAP
jgi:flagellin-like protein